MTDPPITLTIDPDARLWRGMIERRWSEVDERARQFRRELGLPTDRPIIAAGHEAAYWHGGVIAKVFALQSAARQVGGSPAWIVVDHAEVKFHTLRVPVRGDDGRLRAAEWRLCPDAPPGTPAAGMSAFDPQAKTIQGLLPEAAGGVERIAAALRARRGEPNAAMQVSQAMFDLLGEWGSGIARVPATAMARTSLMRELVERMLREPERAVGAYNRAVERFPESGVPPPRREGARWELPIWRLRDGAARERVWSDDELLELEIGTWRDSGALGVPPPDSKTRPPLPRGRGTIAPRALLMTGMMRLAGCELFVHGLGGVRYDHATEAWFGEWLGEELAPMTLVTADVLLPTTGGGATARDVARAKWRAHRARHDPAIVGRDDLAAEKRGHVERIARARAVGGDARADYRAMHAMLEEYRIAEAGRLSAIEAEAEETARRFEESRVLHDRTWPFPLLPGETLRSLNEAVEGRFRRASLTSPRSQ